MTFQSQLDDETLEAYREYLSKNLVFPFAAEHGAEYGHPERVKVIGLGDEYEVVVEEYDSFGESASDLRFKKMPEKQSSIESMTP